MMTKFWIGLLVLMLGAQVALGQQGRLLSQEGRYKALRTAHFTEKMSLRSSEAEVFWPWFNEREAKLQNLKKRQNQVLRQMQVAFTENDEKQIEEVLDQYADMQLREAQIKRTYHEKLKEILPIRKVVLFYRAEKSWQEKIYEWLRQKRQRNGGR